MKYSKKLILDYITGNEILGYDIETLENDANFMMEVIRHTKDKNMFHLCSDELKENYEFIKFIIETFQKDKDFIIKVADEYIEKMPEDDFTKEEIIIYMSNLLGQEHLDNSATIQYHFSKTIFYTNVKASIDEMIAEEKNPKVKQELGLGFVFINDIYKESIIIQDFFAKKMLEEIFYHENISLEERIHQRFKEKDDLENMGIRHYLLNTIRMYDKTLFIYVSCHLELIEQLEKEVSKILKNWNQYLEILNQRRIQILEQEVDRYYDENHVLASYEDCMNHVICKRKLQTFFQKYGSYYATEPTDLNLEDLDTLKFIHYIDDRIKELFRQDIIDTQLEENIQGPVPINQKVKIIQLNPNNP